MKNQIYKRYFGSLTKTALLAALVWLGYQGRVHACPGEFSEDNSGQSIFSPEVLGDEACIPFFRSERFFYLQHSDAASEARENVLSYNTKEWEGFLGGTLRGDELSDLLYKKTVSEVQDMLSKGAFADKNNPYYNSLRFLIYAKKVEPFAMSPANVSEWNPEDLLTPNADQAASLRKEGEDLRKRFAKIPFLLARVNFQIMRVAFYSGQYPEVSDFYRRHANEMLYSPSIRWRAMELAGGALYKQRNYAKANYYFSRVFANFPPLRKTAFFSFHPQEQSDWQQTLDMARNEDERSYLWLMFGIYVDGFEAIRQIYAINPKSKHLGLLLVREVNRAEESFNWMDYDLELPPQISDKDLALVKEIIDEGKSLRPDLWALSLGHLYALRRNTDQAKIYLDKAENLTPANVRTREQIRMSKFFVHVLDRYYGSLESDDYIAETLTYLESLPPFPESRAQLLAYWAKAELGKKYEYASDWIRALMMKDVPTSPAYFNIDKLRALIRFVDTKGTGSKLDQYLVKNFPYSKSQLYELSGIHAAFKGDLEAAYQAFSSMNENDLTPLQADPFLIHIKDCHDCDAQTPGARYNVKTLVEKMRYLSYEVKSGTSEETRAKAAFELGNAFYNITFYGNLRDFYQTKTDNYSNDNSLVRSMDRAEFYYRKVLELTSNSELAARATFMLAKAEQNRYFNGMTAGDSPFFAGGIFFGSLKESFADTQYYKEVIQECGTFRRYLGMPK